MSTFFRQEESIKSDFCESTLSGLRRRGVSSSRSSQDFSGFFRLVAERKELFPCYEHSRILRYYCEKRKRNYKLLPDRENKTTAKNAIFHPSCFRKCVSLFMYVCIKIDNKLLCKERTYKSMRGLLHNNK